MAALLRQAPLVAILALQTICAVYLLRDILASVLGIYYEPLAWQYMEYLDIGAALGLIAGIGLGGVMLARSIRDQRAAEEKLGRARSAFAEVVRERFADWSLSPAERDVALFAIKGLSTAEIAALRKTSEGTVKAQTAAIYRKAGVTGRPQLLSLFIEDLFEPETAGPPPEAGPSDAAPEDSFAIQGRAAGK